MYTNTETAPPAQQITAITQQPQPQGNSQTPTMPTDSYSHTSNHPSQTYKSHFQAGQPITQASQARGPLGQAPPPVMVQPRFLPTTPSQQCPPGLHFLLGTNYLIVQQQLEILEVLSNMMGRGIETPNRYNILNANGQRIYYAAEDRDLFCLQCSGGAMRSFEIPVYDFNSRQVLYFDRPFSCPYCCLKHCCCSCCGTTGSSMTISLGDGTLLGEMIQKCNGCTPLFHLNDGAGNLLLMIKGPSCGDGCCCCIGACGGEVTFDVLLPDGKSVIGEILRHSKDFLMQSISDADNFGVSFPIDLDVRLKAILLGAVFLIDFMYFESSPSQNG